METQMLRVTEVAHLLGISESAVYAAIRRGDIRPVRLGHLYLVPKETVKRFYADDDTDWEDIPVRV
ncbi:MAG: helix-turn-helix domain-containing protein [Armatimonadota bacterium]